MNIMNWGNDTCCNTLVCSAYRVYILWDRNSILFYIIFAPSVIQVAGGIVSTIQVDIISLAL